MIIIVMFMLSNIALAVRDFRLRGQPEHPNARLGMFCALTAVALSAVWLAT